MRSIGRADDKVSAGDRVLVVEVLSEGDVLSAVMERLKEYADK